MIRVTNRNARPMPRKTEPEETVMGRAFLEALARQKAKRARGPQEADC